MIAAESGSSSTTKPATPFYPRSIVFLRKALPHQKKTDDLIRAYIRRTLKVERHWAPFFETTSPVVEQQISKAISREEEHPDFEPYYHGAHHNAVLLYYVYKCMREYFTQTAQPTDSQVPVLRILPSLGAPQTIDEACSDRFRLENNYLCVNPHIFGNARRFGGEGECSLWFYLNNVAVGGVPVMPVLKSLFGEERASKYIEIIEANKVKTGSLIQFLVHKKYLKELNLNNDTVRLRYIPHYFTDPSVVKTFMYTNEEFDSSILKDIRNAVFKDMADMSKEEKEVIRLWVSPEGNPSINPG